MMTTTRPSPAGCVAGIIHTDYNCDWDWDRDGRSGNDVDVVAAASTCGGGFVNSFT